ncbi:MAG TPA: glycoside hydrolase family 2 TIM barrel-domain containing protein, partial [Phycisphaerae bacterium]|nr:glycoside hydrolase family 2 TIM barrel-domain containing protein [Phycisphaerae bacterium]
MMRGIARRPAGFPRDREIILAVVLAGAVPALVRAEYKPANLRLATPWSQDVDPAAPLPEYPRPQMTRDAWQNLNGMWEYAIRPADAAQPAKFDGEILVPFAIESALSGVGRAVKPDERLWYRRMFQIPKDWGDAHVLLHFGAVDWEARCWVNGVELGVHRGGYTPFSFDITKALKAGAANELVLSVWDPSQHAAQPRGKQTLDPKVIWYTPTTGIWQTVWIEAMPARHITHVRLTPDIDAQALKVQVDGNASAASMHCAVVALAGGTEVGKAAGKVGDELVIAIPLPHLWSPDDPYLYDYQARIVEDGKTVDEVRGYFGMRKISTGKDDQDVLRLMLNNQPLFEFGPLDQGFWPDGIYTAPTDEALRFDIEITKRLGFNMTRKHVKVEPARWYYWCDKLGLLVWQDMPSGFRPNEYEPVEMPVDMATQFQTELRAMIDALYDHPAIVMWVIFNEGWGQHDTQKFTAWAKEYDPSRLINAASGWHDRGVGDVRDIHSYPGPEAPPREEKRAAVLGEFGGLGLPVEGHTWQEKKNWGYRSYDDRAALTQAYAELVEQIPVLEGLGLSAAVYTQITDVEIEVNGLLTYDRQVIKMAEDRLERLHAPLYAKPPRVTVLSPSAAGEAVTWRYTLEKPAAGWERSDFDDSGWREAPGCFGREVKEQHIRTPWTTENIWL